MRRRFAELLERHGMRAEIARAWGVTPRIVDKVRDGAPLFGRRFDALPPSVRRALIRACAANDTLPLDAA